VKKITCVCLARSHKTLNAAEARVSSLLMSTSSRITGQGGHRSDVVLNGCQSQGKIKLVASAVAQPRDFHLLFILADRNQHGPVMISEARSEAGMVS
jgi:hypothetical protein